MMQKYNFCFAIRQLMDYFCISEGRKHDAGMLADSGLLKSGSAEISTKPGNSQKMEFLQTRPERSS